MKRTASLSDDGLYRYGLERCWEPELYGAARVGILWVMLNPSTADGTRDDPTLRRCIAFSKAWGYSSLEVVNLYARRTRDPKILSGFRDPVGPDNAWNIQQAIGRSMFVVAAWGTRPKIMQGDLQAVRVLEALRFGGRKVHCLGINQDGSPRHPLYVAADQPAVRYWGSG